MIRYVISLAIIILSSLSLAAQSDTLEVLDYTAKKTYEIGGVEVVGAESKDRSAIKSIAGFREGDKIQVPGLAISKAVKGLLRLRLFDDVQVIQDRVEGEVVFLKIVLVERPTLSRYSFKGVKKSKHDDLNDILKTVLNKGGIVTDAQKNLAKVKLEEYFEEKGKLDAAVTVEELTDDIKPNTVRLIFNVDQKKRVKVQDITFTGNTTVKSRKLRKKMSNTKRKGTLFRKSKFIKENYEEDKEALIAFYNKNGYKDARVLKDSVWREPNGNLRVHIDLVEGNQYYFRNITWKGNSLYSDEQLGNVLGKITKRNHKLRLFQP